MFLSLNFETPGIEVLVVTYEKMKMLGVLHTANLRSIIVLPSLLSWFGFLV